MPDRLCKSPRLVSSGDRMVSRRLHSNLLNPRVSERGLSVGSVIKKRRKRMSKKKHRKLLRKTRVQRRKLGK